MIHELRDGDVVMVSMTGDTSNWTVIELQRQMQDGLRHSLDVDVKCVIVASASFPVAVFRKAVDIEPWLIQPTTTEDTTA